MRRRFSVRTVISSVLLLVAATSFAQTANVPLPERADRIVVEKSKREMKLMRGGQVLKSYRVALGAQPVGAKDRQGDHKTPEGIYSVDSKKPNSQFHRALHLSYPSVTDREKARKLGLSPGGDVEIHGLGAKWGWVGAAHRQTNWTDGCIAVTNEEIDEIWPLVEVGTPVEIRP
jgi:murein L,D-transpeptidase YafK